MLIGQGAVATALDESTGNTNSLSPSQLKLKT